MRLADRTFFPVQAAIGQISKLHDRLTTLSRQLSTGDRAADLKELGADRYLDVTVRARLDRIKGYEDSITVVNTRLPLFSRAIERLDQIEADARVDLSPSVFGTNDVNFGTAPAQAQAQLDEVVNILNSNLDGRYLFSGGATEVRPVAPLGELLNGAGGKAGFKQVADERLQADQGADQLGRLTRTTTGSAVTLTEDGNHPFGFKLSTLTENDAAGVVALTTPGSSAPRSLTVSFSGQPLEGDNITLGLTLPDGSEHTITLKAVAGTPAKGEYQIGADAAATAANFGAALETSLKTAGKAELAAASNYAAAGDFFNSGGAAVKRVAGPDFASATTLVDADPTTTVQWYRGENTSDPRGSVAARIDDAATARYGAQANESGPANLVRSLAVVAIQNFLPPDVAAEGRYNAIADRNKGLLADTRNSESGSIERIGVELGHALVNANNIAERHRSYGAQLTAIVADIESAPVNDVVAELLSVQTRLQASYEATRLVRDLSLVNYL